MDIKLILKQAKQAIKQKDYETSLKLCKQILSKEDNYMAHIFLAVSLQEMGQHSKALTAYREAIKSNPSSSLVWNGLINYYEKVGNSDTTGELVKAYIAFIKTETADEKLMECARKLCKICEHGNLVDVITAIYSVMKNENCPNISELATSIVNILSKEKNFPPDLMSIYEETLKILLNNPDTISVKHYNDYLNLLYKLDKKDELVAYANQKCSVSDLELTSLKWVCTIFNESYVEKGALIEEKEKMGTSSERLLKLEIHSPIGFFTKSVLLFENKIVYAAKELLEQVTSLAPQMLHASVLLLKCYAKLELTSDAIQLFEKIESSKKLKGNLQQDVIVTIIEVLSKSDKDEDLKRALSLYETVADGLKNRCSFHTIRANIGLGNFEKAKSMLKDLETSNEQELLTAQLLHKQKKYPEALQILENKNVELCEWWMEVGELYWDCGQYNKSIVPFLKAAKLDSDNYKCFLKLGRSYDKVSDVEKARRCYEKAFKMNRKCLEAGNELSRIYRKLKNWDANLTLLQALTGTVVNEGNSWAWFQLGLHYTEQQDYEKAIFNLRNVVRIDENNINCWEALADAYLAKGAFTSALKCYENVSSLSQDALYANLQRATIKKILGDYVEARSMFEEILKSNNLYVPALKGFAETSLLQAKQCLRHQRLGKCRDHVQSATDYLTIALQQRTDLSCLWKLFGDSCLLVTNLPEKYCCLLLPSSVVDGKPDGKSVLEKDDLFNLAAKCYYKALSYLETNVPVWYDLAVCFLSQSYSVTNPEQSQQLINKALSIAQYCVLENPSCWEYWNIMGNIAVELDPPNFKLAQHAFIKAVVANNNSSVAWCNLGTMYFILEEYKLANEAYSRAQRADPNYVNSWIGQALLAESLAPEHAMDLFRHSSQLGFHKQSALGYAYWVCKTLKESPLDSVIYSIHNMCAIPVAYDEMTWYIEYHPTDSTAWNMMGFLSERMNLHSKALESFGNSLRFSTRTYLDLARVNYGRLLIKFDRYSEAVDTFNSLEEAMFCSGTGLALALFKDKRYKESYEVYESTLHWLSEEATYQSEILVALASMAYMFDGPDATKTLLFQSIQFDNPSPWGLYALFALGLLHKDGNLTRLVMTEMKKYADNQSSVYHFTTLLSYFHLLKHNGKGAIAEVCKMIHLYPDKSSVWSALTSILIRLRPESDEYSSLTVRSAQVAMKLKEINANVGKILCLASLSFHIRGDLRNSLLIAQKAIHSCPILIDAWLIFIAVLLKIQKLPFAQVRRMISFVQNLNCNSDFSDWIQKITLI